MIKRIAKEIVYISMGLDESLWQEASIFEKIGHVVGTILFVIYFIILPTLVSIGLAQLLEK